MKKSKLEKIEELYCQYDFLKLISKYWSDNREYNNEALQLAVRLNYYDTVASIQQKVWDIFYHKSFRVINFRNGSKIVKSFSKEDVIKKIGSVDTYLDFAKKIKEILDE